jgi:hypothetical protein
MLHIKPYINVLTNSDYAHLQAMKLQMIQL